MKKLILAVALIAASCPLIGQTPVYQNVIFVGSAPSGACTNGSPAQIVISTGALYTCQASVWGTVGGGSGSGTVNAGLAGQFAYYGANGTAVSGVTTETYYFSPGVNGAACNDSTDDTAAFNALVSTVYTAGGGEIVVVGTCLLNSAEITFPHTNSSSPTQPALRITGLGSSYSGYWSAPPASPSALDLRFNATDAKLVTLGAGTLEIDHLTLKDGGSDCAPFILGTNTTLKVHDVVFSGTTNQASACNDALILGGTTTSIGQAVTSAFQGYGTVIENNFFHQIQRELYGRIYVNGVVFQNNTGSNSSGSGLTDGSAIEFDSSAVGGNYNVGNVVSGNLIEAGFYAHAVKCVTCNNSSFFANNVYDAGASYLSTYLMNETNGYNYITAGYNTDTKPLVTGTDLGTTTSFTSHQNQLSTIVGGLNFPLNSNLYINKGGTALAGPYWLNAFGNQWNINVDNFSTTDWLLTYTQTGGSPVTEILVKDGNGGAGLPWIILPSSIEAIVDCGGSGGTAACLLRGSDMSLGSASASVHNQPSTWLVTAAGLDKAVGFESGGTKFTASGCTSITSTVGGASAGKFTIGGNACTVAITMNGATGLTAANGWSCHANDETTAAGNTGLYFSTNNATTATLTVPATAITSDVIDFACTAF